MRILVVDDNKLNLKVAQRLLSVYKFQIDLASSGKECIYKYKAGNHYAASVMRFATQNDYWLVASKKEEFDKFGEKGAPAPKPENEEKEAQL